MKIWLKDYIVAELIDNGEDFNDKEYCDTIEEARVIKDHYINDLDYDIKSMIIIERSLTEVK